MDFMAIIGDPGSGKTNMLVRYLAQEYMSGSALAVNMHGLKIPHMYIGFEDLCNAGDEVMDRFIGMDELGVGADSYDFLSKNNRGITKFVAQVRKFHCRCVYTVQRLSMVSRRLRLLTDGYISMSDPDKFNMYYPDGRAAKSHREVCRGIFRAEYFNRDGRLIKRRMFNGRRYWPLYDTDERIGMSAHSDSQLEVVEDEDDISLAEWAGI